METSYTSLILIRHMKTEADPSGGKETDNPPISEMGRREAVKLTEGLSARQIARIYSSDLRRAQETAQIIAGALGVPLELRSQFRELPSAPPEALRASEQIVTEAVDDIALLHRDSTIAIVAHSGTIRAIARHLLQLPLGTYAVPSVGNGGMLVFRKNGPENWTATG